MFELSRNKWHYKYYRYLRNFMEDSPAIPFRKTWARRDYKPKSLCSYFWVTVLLTLSFPLVILALTCAGIVAAITSPIWYPIMRRKKTMDERWFQYKYGDGPRPTRDFWGKRTDKEPGKWIVAEWFRAYKKQHCPLVKLVD